MSDIYSPKVIEVIESWEKRGKGVEGDPVRRVRQYHSLKGEFLAEMDPLEDAKSSGVGRP